MDLVEFIHQEEHQGSSVSGRSIVFRGNVDVDLSGLSNFDLLFDFGRKFFRLFETFNECDVLCQVTLGLLELLE
jgi:hypothetical protein